MHLHWNKPFGFCCAFWTSGADHHRNASAHLVAPSRKHHPLMALLFWGDEASLPSSSSSSVCVFLSQPDLIRTAHASSQCGTLHDKALMDLLALCWFPALILHFHRWWWWWWWCCGDDDDDDDVCRSFLLLSCGNKLRSHHSDLICKDINFLLQSVSCVCVPSTTLDAETQPKPRAFCPDNPLTLPCIYNVSFKRISGSHQIFICGWDCFSSSPPPSRPPRLLWVAQ